MQTFVLNPIGKVQYCGDKVQILINEKYRSGLIQLDDFKYINVVWWFDKLDNQSPRLQLTEIEPYKNAPNVLGVFATRSPSRPNPIALTCCSVIAIDIQKGIIDLGYIDAEDGSPVLDIKPYMPSLDRVEDPQMPNWCSNWPMSLEKSASFDWSKVFNF